MLELINRISTGKSVLISFIVFILFTALVLPRQARISEERIGSGESPDTAIFYSSEDLYRIAEEYGEDGRQAYIRARWTFDVIWPLVYLFFLGTGTSWFGSQIFSKKQFWQLPPLIPVGAALFDYLENTATSIVMAFFPETASFAANLAPYFSATKWIMISLAFVIYLIEMVVYIVHRISKSIRN